ncbi:MAG: pentapeptide repeat-containing protein [Pseudonocardiales bacterium]|nr:pentapeptide repeat-containing protein [Pseudonocardiales bacterium]
MSARSSRPDSPTPRPLSNWVIAAGALVVLAVAVVIWFVLLRRYGGQGATVQLDAIRTAGTLVIGTGGAVALLLTARRQRYTELSLVHTDRDATERRITELYTKAADQLGSEQAPVRLAGLYALERLAHSTIAHRQTIVDVICAYLRMPYTPPPQPSARVPGRSYRSPRPARRRRGRPLTDRPPHTPPTVQESRHEHAQQERQVRLTAQNILLRNFRVVPQRRLWWQRTPPPAVPTWPGIRLDLTGAVLLDFSLSKCQLDHADFTRAQFTDAADFRGAQFTDAADFWNAQFTGWADFWNAQFTRTAGFSVTQFTRTADFSVTQFTGMADFRGAQFTGTADFRGARFTGGTDSSGARFTGGADFRSAQFTEEADFRGARVALAAEPGSAWPPGWLTRSAQPDNGEDPAFLYLARVEKLPDA